MQSSGWHVHSSTCTDFLGWKKKISLPSSHRTSVIIHHITWQAVPSLHRVKRLLSLNFKQLLGLVFSTQKYCLKLEGGNTRYYQFCPKLNPWVLFVLQMAFFGGMSTKLQSFKPWQRSLGSLRKAHIFSATHLLSPG